MTAVREARGYCVAVAFRQIGLSGKLFVQKDPVLPKNKNNTRNTADSPRVVIDFALLRTFAARNFRDLGGHPTIEGRRDRKGLVYRSSHLAEVPPESPISQLHLRTLVTLQSRVEVKHLGAPQPAGRRGVRWEHIPM